MDKRGCTIVSAYTGFLCGEFSWFHGYVEELFCGPVFTHQFSDKEFINRIKEMSKSDFIELGKERVMLSLNSDELDFLIETLGNHDDEGPNGQTWKSDRLISLINKIVEIKEKINE